MATSSTTNLATPDPLAEAEVYIAYGRKKQALEVLEKALRENPTRTDIVAKLNELNRPSPSLLPKMASEGSLRVDPASEMQAIYQEGEDLRRTGASEDFVTARLEERLQSIATRLEKETAEKIAEIQATYASSRGVVFPNWFRLPAVIAAVFIIAGSLLELIIGQQFVFSAADQYRAMIPWLVIFLTPLFAWMWFCVERASPFMANRYPTWWIRWLVMFPLLAILCSAMTATSPLGWFALYGRLWGTPTENIEAKTLAVFTYDSNSRGCHQSARIIVNGNSARICLAKVLSGRSPVVGESLVITGRTSNAGVFIDEVHAKH